MAQGVMAQAVMVPRCYDPQVVMAQVVMAPTSRRVSSREPPLLSSEPRKYAKFVFLKDLFLGNFSAHADGKRRGAESNRRVASERPRRDASLGTLRSTTGPRRFAVGHTPKM